MNLSIYGVGDGRRRQWLIVDCGVSFASEEHLPGVDLILPDIRFLIEQRRNIVGLVLTHAHEDHMGALIDLWPRLNVPLYASPFAAALFEARRLSEPGAPQNPGERRAGRRALGAWAVSRSTSSMSPTRSRNRTRSRSALRSARCFIPATGRSIRRRCSARRPITAKLTALGDAGVLALVGDSTNAVRDGRSPSEADVAKTLTELIRTAPARVAVTTFASHVGRIRAVADAARLAGREVVRGRPRHGAGGRRSRAKPAISTACRISGRPKAMAICRPTRCSRFAPAARAKPRAALVAHRRGRASGGDARRAATA